MARRTKQQKEITLASTIWIRQCLSIIHLITLVAYMTLTNIFRKTWSIWSTDSIKSYMHDIWRYKWTLTWVFNPNGINYGTKTNSQASKELQFVFRNQRLQSNKRTKHQSNQTLITKWATILKNKSKLGNILVREFNGR